MACPHETNSNLHQLPCHFVPHPKKQHIYYCDACCKEKRNIRNMDNESDKGFIPVIVGIILVIVGAAITFDKPTKSVPPAQMDFSKESLN
jgi:hypothetical protein